MNIQNLINKIFADVVNAPNRNRIIGVINDTIRQINTLIEPFDAIITVGTDADTEWDTVTTSWESIDTDWEDLGRFTNWFTYNTTDNSLTVKNNRIQRIKKVYLDGLALREVSYEDIETSLYTGNELCIVGKTIYFATNISGASSGVLKMKVTLSFPPAKSTDISYNIPDMFEDVIYNNVIYLLSNDEDQKSLAKSVYDRELEAIGIKTNIYGVRQ